MFNAHDLRVINRSMQACFGLSKRGSSRCLPQCPQKYTRNSQPLERQRCPPFAIPLFPALPLAGRDGPMRFAQYGFDAKVITRNLPAAILHATLLPYNSLYSSSGLVTLSPFLDLAHPDTLPSVTNHSERAHSHAPTERTQTAHRESSHLIELSPVIPSEARNPYWVSSHCAPQLAYSIPLRFSGFLTPYSEFSTAIPRFHPSILIRLTSLPFPILESTILLCHL